MTTLQETFTQTFLLYQTLFIIPVMEATTLLLTQLNLLWFNFNMIYTETLSVMQLQWATFALMMVAQWQFAINQTTAAFVGFRLLVVEIINKLDAEFAMLVEHILSGLGAMNHNFNITGLHALELGDMIMGAMFEVRTAIEGVSSAFQNLAAAAQAAAADVANAIAIIIAALAAFGAAVGAVTASPEFVVHHAMEDFAHLMRATAGPTSDNIGTVAAAIQGLGMATMPPNMKPSNATTNNLSVNTNVSGVPIMDEGTLTDVIYDKFQEGQGRA